MAKRIKLFKQASWDNVNSESKTLLDDYILELKSTGKSEKTIYQYVADIKGFLCWIEENQNNVYILDLKKRVFRRFFLVLMDNGTSSARINRLQSSIRNLLEFATQDEDEYEYDVNAMRAIKGLAKSSVRDIVFLSNEQVDILINYLMDHKQYEKALYVSLSYDSAGRRNEVSQVLKEGFVESNQSNVVRGKRGKTFRLIYFNRTREIAKKYMEQRGEDDIPSLWVIGRGETLRPASYQTLYNWVMYFRKVLKAETGEDININPHSFRHSALENYGNGTHHVLEEMGKSELPLEVLKIIAHHTSIETTQGYLKNHDDDILEDTFGIKIKNEAE
ncbi:tyrosine-type recombinase/integrase [Pediococcus pentosaceus]|uniref:tyrosine-type recombinase/integrase n=1 Tax=Pediococcus pentosaceus TaxID=1255 RepID=UPI00232F1E65|nr:tyrosine-type recombinase/integrase [Pediococcus pentosaceus]MDB1562990.1 tyrosine-type recombinase/integrase [Pediococcus pentosaceus]